MREKRKRLSREQRRLIGEYLDTLGPRRCYVENCPGKPTYDHIDGNKNNNQLTNFRWACPRHQRRPAMVASKLVCVRNPVGDAVGPQDNLVEVRERLQARLTDWLMKWLGPDGPAKFLPVREIMQEASYDCHMGSVTIWRYLVNPGELCASNAPFRLIEIHWMGDRPGRKTKCIMWRGRRLEGDPDGAVLD